MLIRAIKTNQLEFIYCIFCYNKNYQDAPPSPTTTQNSGSKSEIHNLQDASGSSSDDEDYSSESGRSSSLSREEEDNEDRTKDESKNSTIGKAQ